MGETVAESIEAAEYLVGAGVVHPWHVDQFGHMNARWYAHFFDDAVFQFLTRIGLDPTGMVTAHGIHTVTAQATTKFRAELLAGTCVEIFGRIARIGNKSLTLEFRLAGASGGTDRATCETTEVFVDAKTHQAVPIPDAVRQRLEEMQAGQG